MHANLLVGVVAAEVCVPVVKALTDLLFQMVTLLLMGMILGFGLFIGVTKAYEWTGFQQCVCNEHPKGGVK